MPRITKLERDEAEKILSATADLNLGAGLWLRFPRRNNDGAARSAYLIFRYTAPDGVRRETGLGVMPRTSAADIADRLGDARAECNGYRLQLRQGVDPIAARKAEQQRARQALQIKRDEKQRARSTLARVAREYHEKVIEPNRTTKHSAQWIASLERNVADSIWHKPIDQVEAPELLNCIAGLQAKVPETASRVRQRLEAVFDHAEFLKLCAGNPARAIRRKLRETKSRRQRTGFAALPYADAPAFMRDLRAREGIAARALEFAMLTAARTGEVIGATWPEFDLAAGLWTVLAQRMKGGEPHVVFLTPRAVEIVRSMQELQQPYVFPSPPLNGKPLSNMGMLTVLRRMDADRLTTVHGLCRATFSTWAHETAAARPDAIEACLAHREGDLVARAYNKATYMQERRQLLAAWADYLDGKGPASNVIEFAQRRAA